MDPVTITAIGISVLGGFVLNTASRSVSNVVGRWYTSTRQKAKPSTLANQSPRSFEAIRSNSSMEKLQLEQMRQSAHLKTQELSLQKERNDVEIARLNVEKELGLAEHSNKNKALELESRLVALRAEEIRISREWQAKREEITRKEREFRAEQNHLYWMLLQEMKRKDIELKIGELQCNWDSIRKNWPSRLSRLETEEILLKRKANFGLLVLIAPPEVSRGCPDSMKDNLRLEIRSGLSYFVQENYISTLSDRIEFLPDYFNRAIFKSDVLRLKRVLEPIPTVILYCDISEEYIHFHIDSWGWTNKNQLVSKTSEKWNWREFLHCLEDQSASGMSLIRQKIMRSYEAMTSFLIDWYFICVDRFYEPRLGQLKDYFADESIEEYANLLEEVRRYHEFDTLCNEAQHLEKLGYCEQAIEKLNTALDFDIENNRVENYIKQLSIIKNLESKECGDKAKLKPSRSISAKLNFRSKIGGNDMNLDSLQALRIVFQDCPDLLSVVELGSLSDEQLRHWLRENSIFSQPVNMWVTGRTGAGKTQFGNTLLDTPNISPRGRSRGQRTARMQIPQSFWQL